MTSDRSREQSPSSPAFLEGLRQRPSQHRVQFLTRYACSRGNSRREAYKTLLAPPAETVLLARGPGLLAPRSRGNHRGGIEIIGPDFANLISSKSYYLGGLKRRTGISG
jgi:hypothetical protein